MEKNKIQYKKSPFYKHFYKCPLCGEIIEVYLKRDQVELVASDATHNEECPKKIEGLEYILLNLIGSAKDPVEEE